MSWTSRGCPFAWCRPTARRVWPQPAPTPKSTDFRCCAMPRARENWAISEKNTGSAPGTFLEPLDGQGWSIPHPGSAKSSALPEILRVGTRSGGVGNGFSPFPTGCPEGKALWAGSRGAAPWAGQGRQPCPGRVDALRQFVLGITCRSYRRSLASPHNSRALKGGLVP